MRELYPDIDSQMRYRLKDIKRYADLYFNLNGEELVIEFQRTDLDGEIFEEKVSGYKKVNIDNIWLLSGNGYELEKCL